MSLSVMSAMMSVVSSNSRPMVRGPKWLAYADRVKYHAINVEICCRASRNELLCPRLAVIVKPPLAEHYHMYAHLTFGAASSFVFVSHAILSTPSLQGFASL
jgi:hypothetical protein